MPRSRYRFLPGDNSPYFVTCTTVNWLPLFSNPDIAGIILHSLKFLIGNNRLILYAYVVMENHLHLIAASERLDKEIGDFKSFTARACIDYYQEHQTNFVLEQLAFHKLAHKTDRPYQFWQEGSHPQRILDREMMTQKAMYIHYNPVKRGYVDHPEHWRYSSARDYCGQAGTLPVCLDW